MPGLLLLLPLPGGGRQLFFLCGFLYVKSVEGFLLRRRGWWWRGLPSLLTGLFLLPLASSLAALMLLVGSLNLGVDPLIPGFFSFFHESVPAPFHEWLDSPLFQELGFLHQASCVVDACEDAAGSGATACAVAAAPGRGFEPKRSRPRLEGLEGKRPSSSHAHAFFPWSPCARDLCPSKMSSGVLRSRSRRSRRALFRDALLLVSRLLRRPCPEGSNM